jgi:CBS domain-containing protein
LGEIDMDLTPEAVTQSTSIGEVDRLLQGTDPILVTPNDSLQRLAELAVDRPGCRVLSVVDESRRLIGLVPVRLLVNDIFLKIVPEEFLGVISGVEDVMEYARHLRARTAADIMLPPTSVRRDATVRDAFETMHHARLNGLPIVDEQGGVVSYLDQLELLLVWVRASGREPLLRPIEESAEDASADASEE